jgi:hypothetical protein
MRFMPKNDLRELAETPVQQLVTNSFALLALVFLAWAGYTVGFVGRGGRSARADPQSPHE